ncbi:transcriptional regulator [Kamptonema sp. UHCC 0994]|nr:transcriptional regulator [Kamptonema sp. UHCC 0994]MDF0556785.1 transcriptional regulator [Kamptonema sp. UHCC 0994]
MQKVKMPKSDSYDEFLIESLKDSGHAAGFIEAILEEKNPEPALLRNAVRKVVEARSRMNNLADSTQLKHEKLDKLLTASGCAEIYAFVELLDALGFRLAVTVKDDELMTEESVKVATTINESA